MALEILQDKGQIIAARREMMALGVDCADRGAKRFLKRLKVLPGVVLGDPLKSWDVFNTLNFLDEHVSRKNAVLDLGAYASEVLPALYGMGYANLLGIDLNPEIRKMPYSEKIHYLNGDMYRTPFPDKAFSAITAISVIEHGFDQHRLLYEVSRLLIPGGFFLASVDYWPQKINTNGVEAFGLDWTIFSQKEIESLVAHAEAYGLIPVGEMKTEGTEAPINWLGKNYTFAWLALIRAD